METTTDMIRRRDAAKRYGVSEKTFERAIKNGDLPAYRPGRYVMVKTSDIDQWILNYRKVKTSKVIQAARGRTRQTILNGKVWR